jgi:hypothetical protein
MKQFLFITFLVSSSLAFAKDAKNEWNGTSLTEATIKKIQQAQYGYKKCVTDEMMKVGYAKIESRSATDAIIKQCEKELAKMRQVYLDVEVPGVIADRHLKKMRFDITRRVLKQLMFAEAARKTGK